MSIRFNDELTSTFEYPSESSLCEEIGLSNGDTNFDDDDTDLLYSNGHFLGSSPIGKYKKKAFDIFQPLGTTKSETVAVALNLKEKNMHLMCQILSF